MSVALFLEKMLRKEISKEVRENFLYYYEQLCQGTSGLLTKNEILPIETVPYYSEMKNKDSRYYRKLAIIKLNGGLGTSMGLAKAKSLLPVKNGLSFLDIIARQVLALRKNTGCPVPLVFMNSFNTAEDTEHFLENYPDLKISDLPQSFCQNQFPKIVRDTLAPLANANDKLNWNPPGHGDIYLSMALSGTLERLLAFGYEYAFISNSDNLGALPDEKLLTYFAEQNLPFLMEVCLRTEMDKKGGHLAKTKDGKLLLREIAQCPVEEKEEFESIDYYKYFNTNNLWINLKSLQNKMAASDYKLPLPLIVNPKTVEGTKVFQLETAMGAAIGIFPGAQAVLVPRERFAPVKKTGDLITVWSDAYKLTDDYQLLPVVNPLPVVELDEQYYRTIDLLSERFIYPPSLSKCKKLTVKGDFTFGENVKIINNTILIADNPSFLANKTLEGEVVF